MCFLSFFLYVDIFLEHKSGLFSHMCVCVCVCGFVNVSVCLSYHLLPWLSVSNWVCCSLRQEVSDSVDIEAVDGHHWGWQLIILPASTLITLRWKERWREHKQRERERKGLFKQQTGSGCFQSSLPSCCFCPFITGGPRWVEKQPTPHFLPALWLNSCDHTTFHNSLQLACFRALSQLYQSHDSCVCDFIVAGKHRETSRYLRLPVFFSLSLGGAHTCRDIQTCPHNLWCIESIRPHWTVLW